VALGVALHERRQAQESSALLASLRSEHERLRAETASTAQRLAATEQRARAAEDDSTTLLTAIDNVRRSQAAPSLASATAATKQRLTSPPEKKATATAGPQVRLRLIQLSRQPGDTDATLANQANTILARLRSGESFAGLAQEFSTDKRKEKGGDWGWLKPEDFRPEWSAHAFRLNKGDVSPPLLAPEGCFIIYVEDRK